MRCKINIAKMKRMTGRLVFLAIMWFSFCPHVFAQTDPIFTQYMNSIQTVNPAYAGMWEKVGVQVFAR